MPSSLRRDIVSAYFASAAKVGSWAMMTALTIQWGGVEDLAVLALVRATLGLLSYTTLGLGPAMIHFLARASKVKVVPRSDPDPISVPAGQTSTLEYARPMDKPSWVPDPVTIVYNNGLIIAIVCGVVGAFLLFGYVSHIDSIHKLATIPRLSIVQEFVTLFGFGFLFRLCSEAPGALIQTRGYIWLDNLVLAVGELLWIVSATKFIDPNESSQELVVIGGAYAASGLFVLSVRLLIASWMNEFFIWRHAPVHAHILWGLLKYGLLLTIAQLADFLYAPVDFILINRLISPEMAAYYTPAVQIDAGLLLLVSGLANVLLPRAALAHAAGNRSTLLRYYVRGTIASVAVLLPAAMGVWLLSPWIFERWLANPMRPTQAILPFILIHTVVGGSSAVGRAILLGMGKVRPFTISVLITGATNVVLSFCFVRFFGLGLIGIVLGTIIAVVGRCAIWMPWYVMRTLRAEGVESDAAIGPELQGKVG